jgi:hypothetical protein
VLNLVFRPREGLLDVESSLLEACVLSGIALADSTSQMLDMSSQAIR